MCWSLILQNYDYTIEHRPNERMRHVDALSRVPNILILEGNTLEQTLALRQTTDENIIRIRKLLEESNHPFFVLRNGLVYRKLKGKIVFHVSSEMEQHILYTYYNNMGYFGIDKTYILITRTYWFSNLKIKIKDFINNCLKCIEDNPKSGKKEGLLYNITKGKVPFEVIHIDHYGPHSSAASQKHVFEVIDGFTKYVRLYPCKTMFQIVVLILYPKSFLI